MTAGGLLTAYKMFGEDPWITPTPDGVERFSARLYAEQRARAMTGASAPAHEEASKKQSRGIEWLVPSDSAEYLDPRPNAAGYSEPITIEGREIPLGGEPSFRKPLDRGT